MTTFLEHVAQHIIAQHGTDLSRMAVVFPNKRASIFLNQALARQAGHPIWSPAYITISDLFRRHASQQVADTIKLVCDLHRVYTRVTGFDETLDHFYGWGQLLLSDFDDIDKHLAPPHQVFTNLSSLHEMDDTSYLTDEQRQVIRQFFANFSDEHGSQLKERFLRLWSRMEDIYHAYNQLLSQQQLAYEGALYRRVAEDESLTFDYDTYLFVGFNLLLPVEQRLFATLMRQQKARFYWDFDHSYLDSEAGLYIRHNLEHFPNELDSRHDDIYRCSQRPKTIEFVAAPTENIQARYATQWLRRHIAPPSVPGASSTGATTAPDTAIVLCDEQLLTTVIHCLPQEVEHVNVTTGYPLQLTPVATLLQQLISLRTTGFDHQRQRYRLRQVNAVLRNPFAVYVSESCHTLLKQLNEQHIYYPEAKLLATDAGLSQLFATPCGNNLELLQWMAAIVALIARNITSPTRAGGSDAEATDAPAPDGQAAANAPLPPHQALTAEALYRAYLLLSRLTSLVESGDLTVDVITLTRLIGQLIEQTTIPFHGEPAIGLQVMGVLETRNLDFDRLLLLSANEGNMPRGINDTSFIPYSIRKAFGLTTADSKVAIQAYYFHRLIARATHVTIAYNNATADGHTGEMSRFMLQLMVEGHHPVSLYTLQAAHQAVATARRPVAKTPAVVEVLRRRFESTDKADEAAEPLLTPTAINRYMRCPLQFYYNYVEGLREPEETDDDTIDNRIFGNIFHQAAQQLYTIMTSNGRGQVTASAIDKMLAERVTIERCVDQAINDELFHSSQGKEAGGPKLAARLNGLQIINRQVIIHYLRTLLESDRRLTPFTILALEADVVEPMHIESIGMTTTIGGRIDRLDLTAPSPGGSQLRVVDYKTGAHHLTPLPSLEAVFDPAQLRNHNDYFLQAMLYARLVSRRLRLGGEGTLPAPQDAAVAPALLFIQHAAVEGYDPVLQIGRERLTDMGTDVGQQFERMLKEKVEEIFAPDNSFTPTDNSDTCRTCPYLQLCGMEPATEKQ